MQGRWFCCAISCARRCFFTVIGKVGAALDRGVVGHDHAFAPADPADAGDDAGGRNLVVVHVPGRELRQLQKRRAHVEQRAHALARQQFAASRCFSRAASPPPCSISSHLLAQVGDHAAAMAAALAWNSALRGSSLDLRTGIAKFVSE